MSIISLLTDFSISDGFIGTMKGAILQINSKVNIVDLAHNISKFSIKEGSFVLKNNYTYFPHGTIFCVVVDPGVGTKRKAIAVKTEKYFFIGPDNGVLFPMLQKEKVQEIRELTNEKYQLSKVSHTFHGRDIFAPAAAHISKREELFSSLGSKVKRESLVKLELQDFKIDPRKATGKIVKTDGFGNIIINIPIKELINAWGAIKGKYKVKLGDLEVNARFVNTFSEGKKGEFLLLEENHGFLQLSLKEKAASEVFDRNGKERVKIYRK